MKSAEILPYLSRIAVAKNITGAVQVTTPKGPVLVTQPGLAYVLASTKDEVGELLRYNTNLRTLLNQRQLSLVF